MAAGLRAPSFSQHGDRLTILDLLFPTPPPHRDSDKESVGATKIRGLKGLKS